MWGRSIAHRKIVNGDYLFQYMRPIRDATYRYKSDSPAAYFNVRTPCGALQYSSCKRSTTGPFQSMRPTRGATTLSLNDDTIRQDISIYAPHTGRNVRHLRKW